MTLSDAKFEEKLTCCLEILLDLLCDQGIYCLSYKSIEELSLI